MGAKLIRDAAPKMHVHTLTPNRERSWSTPKGHRRLSILCRLKCTTCQPQYTKVDLQKNDMLLACHHVCNHADTKKMCGQKEVLTVPSVALERSRKNSEGLQKRPERRDNPRNGWKLNGRGFHIT